MTISSPQELCEFLSKSSTNVSSDFTHAINYINNATDLDYTDENGRTALSYASEIGSEKIVELLIDKGADVNLLPNADSYTPLMFATLNRSTKVIKLLLYRGADINIKNSEGRSATDIAMKSSNIEVQNLLGLDMTVKIDQKFSQDSFLDKYPKLLHNEGVCSGFNIEITRWAMKHIEKGEPEEQIDVIGKINSALQKDSDHFAKRLILYQSEQYEKISHDVYINYKKDNFFDSLPDGMKNKKFIGFSFGVFDNKGKCEGGHTIHVRRIGDSSAYEVIDVNKGSRKCENKEQLNHHIETILYSYHNTSTLSEDMRDIRVYDIEEIVRKRDLLPEPLLQDAKEEVQEEQKKRNKEKKYQLEGSVLLALESEAPSKFIKDLIEHADKDNLDYQYQNGYTALMLAASSGNLDIAKLLVEKGADLNVQRNDGYTALMLAASSGNLDIAKLLVEKGADLDVKEYSGVTTLILAVSSENLDMTKLLVEKGADLDVQEENGYTALMFAVANENLNIIELLVKKGSDIDIKCHNGQTALDLARNEQSNDLIISKLELTAAKKHLLSDIREVGKDLAYNLDNTTHLPLPPVPSKKNNKAI